ncbi:MAG: iron transporter [Gammaproteobacteria bacterium]|nr:iron transporter [Gammaproteobacteria bacterium]
MSSAGAIEYPIGVPEQRFGMEIAAVYLQPIGMEPDGMMRPAEQSDVHLEADIRAMDINPNGFAEGEWIPYLQVQYEVVKADSGEKIAGDFMPMVANDGPHYGDNVKLFGYGKYRVKYTIHAPVDHPAGHHFGRHTDRLTGVRPWFKPFTVEWEFIYSGIGKKGGY